MDEQTDGTREAYEPPSVRELGSVHELTQVTPVIKTTGHFDGVTFSPSPGVNIPIGSF